jgi:hypothetical protein
MLNVEKRMKRYYKTPEEAEEAARKEYYRSAIKHQGRIGGPDCPPTYRGDARVYIQEIPPSQRKY